MKYKYSGVNRSGARLSGEIEAANAADAQKQLRQLQIRPIKLTVVKGPGGFSLSEFFNNPTPAPMEFTAFIRQLATMQGAGIPIVQALGVLADQAENLAFGKVLKQVQSQIEQGTGLTDALKKHPKVFDRIFLNLVAAGEVSGALDAVLNRLAIFYEKSAQLRRKIKGAMTYPMVIISLVFIVVFILLKFVVPTFAKMFTQGGKELPGPTQLVIDMSNFVGRNWIFIVIGIAGAIYGLIQTWSNEEARKVIDPYMMKIPLFGPLIQKVAIARFSRTLGTMIQSGVPIIDALEITARVAGNYAVEAVIKTTGKSISEGNSIARPLSSSGVFPKMAISMIAIGEQTGSLEQMLTKIAEFYEDEVDAAVGSLTSILEPLMIVIVGLVVAGVLIPMYLPIFKMGDAIGAR